VSAGSRRSALLAGGRYYDHDHEKWVCFGCGSAPEPTEEELRWLEE
jgi:hypothetical protein